MEEAPLKAAMIRYGLDILGLSILISIITAALVYLTLDTLLVKPMTKLTRNMVRFSERPEDPTRIVTPSGRGDEIGTAERELAAMQTELAGMLSQKNRLAALGLAVSKISHDLRNMLSSAQLLSDRLRSVKDERVQHLVPKLLASLDRAIRLCARTLDFGQAQETPPQAQAIRACPARRRGRRRARAAAAQSDRLDARHRRRAQGRCRPRSALPRVEQSLPQRRAGAGERGRRRGEIVIAARREGAVDVIDVRDTGPGVPERAKTHLFQAFQSVARKGRHRAWARHRRRARQRPWRPDRARSAMKAAPPSASSFPTWWSSSSARGAASA